MARVIQTQIKTPLADEVLFGRLKNGGVVRVVVTGDETGEKKLGFVYPEGPAQPRLERELVVANRERGKDGKPLKPRRKTDASTDPDDDAPGEKTPSEPETI
jgi:ATP-dependent Clp protease ATP-binding subunit ClpA